MSSKKRSSREEEEVISVSSGIEEEEESSKSSSSEEAKKSSEEESASSSSERSSSPPPKKSKKKEESSSEKEESSSEEEEKEEEEESSSSEPEPEEDEEDEDDESDEDASEQASSSEEDSDFERKKTQPQKKSKKSPEGDKSPVKITAAPQFLTHQQRMSRTVTIDANGLRPAFFKLDARPHQVEGIEFMEKLGSAALVYEMGLGKTFMMLAVICNRINKYRIEGNLEEASRPNLVILPKSVKDSWLTDFDKFVDQEKGAISLKCIGEKPLKPAEIQELKEGKYNIVMIGYEKMRTDFMNIVRPLDILPKTFNFGKHRSITMVRNNIEDWEQKHIGKKCPLQLSQDGTAKSTVGTEHWLFGRQWGVLVLDEAHHIRSGTSQVFLASCAIQAKQRYFVSGTPLQNKRDDVYNAFRFIRAPTLVDLEEWGKMGPSNQAQHLAILSGKHLKWKKKEDVEGMSQVPMHIFEYKVGFENDKEREVYSAYEEYMGKIADKALDCKNRRMNSASEGYVGAVHLFSAILAARQCCNAPSIISIPDGMKGRFPDVEANREDWSGKNSTKMKALRAVVDKHIGPDQKFLLFSSMLEALNLSEAVLKELGINCVRLTGNMKDDERKKAIEKFRKDPSIRCFLISLKAGGEGLNLKEAHRVIILDPWWNWQAMLQAMCRSHRLDSEHEVRVTIITISGTVEDVMLHKADEKRRMADDLYSSSTMFEMFAKADGNGRGNSGTGEGKGLNDLVQMVRDSQKTSRSKLKKAGNSAVVDEEKEHEEREVRKKEVMKIVAETRQKKKADKPSKQPETSSGHDQGTAIVIAGSKRKASEEPTPTVTVSQELVPLHVAPIFCKDFKSLPAGCFIWSLSFTEPASYQPLVKMAGNNGTDYYGGLWGGSNYSSTVNERDQAAGTHVSFLGVAEALLKILTKAYEVLSNRGQVAEEYQALKKNVKYINGIDLIAKEAAYKKEIESLPEKIKTGNTMITNMLDFFSSSTMPKIRDRKYKVKPIYPSTNPLPGQDPSAATEVDLICDAFNAISGQITEYEQRLQHFKKELAALEQSRNLTPEKAKAERDTFKVQVAKRIREEVCPSVREIQVTRDLDRNKDKDFSLDGGGDVGYEKVILRGSVKSVSEATPMVKLDPMDFIMYTLRGSRSIYRSCIHANPWTSFQYSMKADQLRADKSDLYDASKEFTVNSGKPFAYKLVPLCTFTYPRASELYESAIKKDNGQLASLIMMAFLIDPPGVQDRPALGRCMYRYAVFGGENSDEFIGAFAFFVDLTEMKIVILGAEALGASTKLEIDDLCTAELVKCMDQKVDKDGKQTLRDTLRHVLVPSRAFRAYNEFSHAITTLNFIKRKDLPVGDPNFDKFKLDAKDIAIAAGHVHERFIVRPISAN